MGDACCRGYLGLPIPGNNSRSPDSPNSPNSNSGVCGLNNCDCSDCFDYRYTPVEEVGSQFCFVSWSISWSVPSVGGSRQLEFVVCVSLSMSSVAVYRQLEYFIFLR